MNSVKILVVVELDNDSTNKWKFEIKLPSYIIPMNKKVKISGNSKSEPESYRA